MRTVSTRLLSAVRSLSPVSLAGFGLLVAVRALTLPRSLWEMDEFLFSGAIGRFEPLQHRPHPPGYPLTVGLGKLFALVFPSHFVSLVALAVVSSLVGYWALVSAFRRISGGAGGTLAGDRAAGGGGRASLPALARNARSGSAPHVGPAGADVHRPGPRRRRGPA